MARRPRIEVEGGLYHVITRGNDRQTIFHSDEDHKKFLLLMATQKGRMPYYLYAYCLMSNHVHLLIERQADTIGRVMHRVLNNNPNGQQNPLLYTPIEENTDISKSSNRFATNTTYDDAGNVTTGNKFRTMAFVY